MDDATADITRVLEAFAVERPDAPAIRVPGRATLRYRDLGAQIRYIRNRLEHWNITRGDIVAGVIPARPEMAVACATLPASATFAPLSAALRPDAYLELLQRLRPKALLIPAGIDHPARQAARSLEIAELRVIPDHDAPAGQFTLQLSKQRASLSRARAARPEWAYVMNTSGTTGRAKLVPRSHRLLALHAKTLGDWWRLTGDDVGCNLLPLHHGHGLSAALMVPLTRGACTVCLPEADVEGFFNALDEFRLTWLTAVFTVHREILRRACDFPGPVARNELRFLRVGSGRLEPAEIDRIEHTFDAPVLMALSGREAMVMTHDPLPPQSRKAGSVGVALCNQIAIMNDAGIIRPTGEVGEIVVRGPLVFEGYFDDPQETANAFVDGWFRTGDLGRVDDDGYLYLAGRIKDLINRGGEKIAPAEIDAVIETMPGIRESAAFAIAHPSLGEEIAAAVVTTPGAKVDAADIVDHVHRTLGAKRAPRRIYFIDRLPRTDTGKLRRAELSRRFALDGIKSAVGTLSDTQRKQPTYSVMESALCAIWAAVLQLERVDRDDDFFLLSGDSLRGTQLLARVRSLFGVELPIDALFWNAATVTRMAREIEAARAPHERSLVS